MDKNPMGKTLPKVEKSKEKYPATLKGRAGYLQRGGIPTAFDRILASKMGTRAVDLLLEGKSNCAIGIKDNHLIDIDILEALTKKKVFDQEMYNLSQTLSL